MIRRDQETRLICDECHEPHAEVRRNRKTGRLTCRTCYRSLHQPKYHCGDCGELRLAATWNDGIPICHDCYENSEQCCTCLQTRFVFRRVENGNAMCRGCARKADDHIQECYICHEPKVCLFQSSEGWICASCYTSSRATICSQCGRLRPANKRIDGQPWCQNCVRKKSRSA